MVFVALLAYLPALLTAPGVVAADTKQYLYLDPARFLGRARSLWDPSQFGGYVTHQQVGYLWPMGPWFWLLRVLGAPVWVAQRLWVGTLILVAALGARALARRLGLAAAPALVAAVAYGFSPYLLSYVSRTSVLLLPWAALGWVLVLTMRAVGDGGWRAPAAAGLVVATVGGVNATALVLVGLGPLLWIVDAVVGRRVPGRATAAAVGRLAVCCVATSLWWIVALIVEGRYGADVLRYSETVGAVSATSSAPEVVRGLGYWLFYGSVADGRWNGASTVYLANPALLLLGATLAAAGLAGLLFTRWQARRWLVVQLFVGAVVAIGAHPPGGASAYGRLLSGGLARTTLVLALRSSTRAVPLVVLSLSLGLAALVAATGARWPRWARATAALAVAASMVNLPALATGGFVDGLLRRPDVPAWWRQAAAELDRRGGGRVLELPGQEFAAYRWGTTTDPILPGLTARPLLTRDLLPLGADQRMNLLYALDQRFQDGTVEPASVAPVARLLGARDVVARLDANWERYGTPPAAATWAALAGAPGLAPPAVFGPVPTPSATLPDLAPGRATATEAPGSVAVLGVTAPATGVVAAVVPASGQTLLVGDGDGVVDSAAAGLLDGSVPVTYSADLHDDASRRAALASGALVVVTDSNRARARQWRGTQDVVGYTEDGLATGERRDRADARPSPFGASPPTGSETLAHQRASGQYLGDRVVASAYGEPNAYRPEDRAWRAVDGDPATAWLVGDRADPVGARLHVASGGKEPVAALHLAQRAGANRSIATVRVRTDHQSVNVVLDESSKTAAGQTIPLDGSPTSSIDVTITATDVPHPPSFFGLDAVGIVELGLTDVGVSAPAVLEEVVAPPTDLDPALAATNADERPDLAYVLTRLRTDPTNRWRSDPEASLARDVVMPSAGQVTVEPTARVDRRATDEVLAQLLDVAAAPSASSSLVGVLAARPWSATDEDPATAWTSALGEAIGSWWERPLPLETAVNGVDLHVVDDEHHSVPTSLRVQVGGTSVDVAVPAADGAGVVHVSLPSTLHGDRVRLTVLDAAVRTTLDRRYGEQVDLPVALAEVVPTSPGDDGRVPVLLPIAMLPTVIDTNCRSDLLSFDGVPSAVRVQGSVADAAAGRPLAVDLCGAPPLAWAAGIHEVRSGAGTHTGIDIDRVVLRVPGRRVAATPSRTGSAGAVRTATVEAHQGPTAYSVHLGAGGEPGWLVLADAINPGWSATIDGRSLGAARSMNAGAAAWPIPAGPATVVRVRWRPQQWEDRAQLASLLAAIVCAGGVLWGLRRRRADRDPDRDPDRDHRRAACSARQGPRFVGSVPDDVRPRSMVPMSAGVTRSAVVGAGVVGALVIHPVYGLSTALAMVGAQRSARGRSIVRAAGPLLVLVGGWYVVARQVVSRPAPGFGWPLAFEAAHRPVLLGLLLAVVAVVSDDIDDERPDTASAARRGDTDAV